MSEHTYLRLPYSGEIRRLKDWIGDKSLTNTEEIDRFERLEVVEPAGGYDYSRMVPSEHQLTFFLGDNDGVWDDEDEYWYLSSAIEEVRNQEEFSVVFVRDRDLTDEEGNVQYREIWRKS